MTWRLHVEVRLISITTNTVGSHGKWTERRGCCLTCKCPWYILSTESVADLSVSGSVDFFQTCRGRESQTGRVGVGRKLQQQSCALGSGGPEEQTERSCPLLRCWSGHFALIQDFSARSDTEARRAQDERDVGRRTALWADPSQCVCAADAGFEQVRVAIYSHTLVVLAGREGGIKKNLRVLSLHPKSAARSLPLRASRFLCACLGFGWNVLTLLRLHSPLIVRSSSLFANYSL